MSKYVVISAPYFPVFGLNTGKYGPDITPYLDTFHAVCSVMNKTEMHIRFFRKLDGTEPKLSYKVLL